MSNTETIKNEATQAVEENKKATPRKTNDELKKTIEKQANEIDSLKEQITALMALMGQNVASKQNSVDKETVVVGCRAFSGAPLANQDESVCYTFSCGEEKAIDISDLKDILKDSGLRKNKFLFRDGIFYFKDEKYYVYFGIKNVVDLSDEAIKAFVLIPDVNAMLRKAKEITKDRTNFNIMHTLKFKIAQMIVDSSQPLMGWRYDSRKALEDYLGCKFDDLVAYTGIYNILGKR